LFTRLFSNPRRQLAKAVRCFQAGREARATKAVDRAIRTLQRRFSNTGSERKSLLSQAWFLKGLLQLKAGNRPQAFRSFFACADRVPQEASCLAFVVNETMSLRQIPEQLYPLLVEYVAKGELHRTDSNYRKNTAQIRKLLRPDPATPGSIDAVERWNIALRGKVENCAWCYYHLGIIAAAKLDWDQACTLLRQAVGLDPRCEAARRLFAFSVLQVMGARDALSILKEGDNLSRGTLILRAHLERLTGDLAASVQFYDRADGISHLKGGQLLGFAETLVRTGQNEKARHLLRRVQGDLTPAGRIVQALALAAQGPSEDVRTPLVKLIAERTMRREAAGALLTVAAAHPEHEGALTALQQIPEDCRDDRYHLVAGACCAAQKRWADSLDAWSRLPTTPATIVAQ
jgi:tetratricopeptide (TPR) repeat protein